MLDIDVMTPDEIDEFITEVCAMPDVTLTVQEKINVIQKNLRWIGTIFKFE